ncbi:MAG: S-adenosylmethionine transporter [Cyphobasidiales sp. Tagirdzhanova-0007]|nr:MAG: S-adenosylmethionine transporter [Cyphobasidiales sp. Tagirdzhanova-0007]
MSRWSSTTFTQALLAGGLAGTSVDVALFPLDTLKTRLQTSAGFWQSGGFRGVYRGLGSVVVGSAPGAAAFFTTYEHLKIRLPDIFPLLSKSEAAPALHMLAASGAETVACLIRVPTEVVKSRQQAATYGTTTGSLQAAKLIFRSSSLRGFYRGFGSTIAREIPFTCIQFPLYEQMKSTVALRTLSLSRVEDLPAAYAALCGSIAGGIGAGLTTPLDVAKTRIMLSTKDTTAFEKPYSPNFFKTMTRIAREEGGSALFRGIVPRVVWISMGGAIFLGVYERTKQALMRNKLL